jgi:hypothetical protein
MVRDRGSKGMDGCPLTECTFLHIRWTEFYKPGVLPEARGDAKKMVVGSGGSAWN